MYGSGEGGLLGAMSQRAIWTDCEFRSQDEKLSRLY